VTAAASAARLAAARAVARYARLRLHAARGAGDRPGERRVPGRPQANGIEIEAFRPYAPGDDLRTLDWSTLARLDALVVRRYTAERALRLDVLLDTTASMDAPASDGKLAAATELALALGTIALSGRDGVRLVTLGGADDARELRGQGAVPALAARLASVEAAGRIDLGAALAAHARRHPGPALAALLTDGMFEPATIADGLAALAARRIRVVFVQVLGRTEVEPERLPDGALLADVESGAEHAIVRDAAACRAFRALLDAHTAALADAVARVGGRFVRLVADEDVATFVTGALARAGVIRRQ